MPENMIFRIKAIMQMDINANKYYCIIANINMS